MIVRQDGRMQMVADTTPDDPIYVAVMTSGGFDWSPILAAFIAAVIALASLLHARASSKEALRHAQAVSEDADRRAKDEASWNRVTWALELAISDDEPTTNVGLISLEAMMDYPEILSDSDAVLVEALARAIWDDVEGA